LDNLIEIASAIRSMALLAELSSRHDDGARWASAVLLLWKDASPDLRPVIQRMQQIVQ